MDSLALILNVIFSSIGMGYTLYGKKQGKAIAFAAGIGLCVSPYFELGNISLLIVGIALIIIPFIFRV